jgi:PAS domain S-box-containing protein
LKDLSGMGEFAAEAIKHDTVSFIAWFADGGLLTANPQFCDMTGYSLEETDVMKWPGDFTDKPLASCIARGMTEPDKDEKSCQCEGNIIRKNRSITPVSIFFHMYHPGHGEEPLYYAFIADTSRLREQEKRLQLTQFAMDHFTDCSVWMDKNGRLVYVNDMTVRVLGYSREELLAMHIWDVDPCYTQEKYREAWEYIKRGGWIQVESEALGKDKKVFPVEVHASYIKYNDTELMITFIHDISERKRADEALAESEEKFKMMADTSFAAILLVQENKFIYANPAALAILGYTAEEIIGQDFWTPVSPEFKEEIKNYGITLLHGILIPGRFEIKFVRKNEETGWADLTVAPIKYHGRPAGVITALDVTDRKRAEEALKESEEKFRVLSELSPSAIFLYQGNKIIYANPAAVEFTGFSIGELLSKNFWDMVHPEYRELVKTYGLTRQRGEPVPARYDVKYLTKSGEERWAEFTAGMIEYKGMPAGIVTAVDTTDRKRTEIVLQDAKAQAELYVDLMGHDINNMNQAALGFLEIASEKLQSEGRLEAGDQPMIASAMESLRNSSKLIGSVRKLQKEKKGLLQPHVMNLGQVLAEVKKHYANVPGRDVTISYNALCECRVQANELLIDVFSNIVGNAIKHSEGPIAINIILQVAEEQEQLYCKVSVEDTGPGIPDAQKHMIFERAGKEHAKLTGKGLGLYLVKTLVDDYGGRVWVEDRVPGDYTKGSRFVVMLPAAGVSQGVSLDDEARACGI